MNFAINYSYPAAALFNEGRIPLDYFKVPNWPHLIAEARPHRPLAVHFDLDAGSGRLAEQADWEQIERLLAETSTPHVNLHLDPLAEHYPGVSVHDPTPAQSAEVVERLLADVWAAVERFGPGHVIVENVPYRAAEGKTMRPAAEPAIIRRVVEETGCGLLFDIQHARIAAHYLGMAERDYIQALPVTQIRELHFAGLHVMDGKLVDHLSVLDADWEVLDWVLAQIRAGKWGRPWLLAFEYGGVGGPFSWRTDGSVMEAQAPRLYEMLRGI